MGAGSSRSTAIAAPQIGQLNDMVMLAKVTNFASLSAGMRLHVRKLDRQSRADCELATYLGGRP